MRSGKQEIQYRLRAPGGFHEWLPVARANLVKAWGLRYADYMECRTPVEDLDFKHCGPGSVKLHHELINIMDKASGFAQYKTMLCEWAEKNLAGGKSVLPALLLK